MNIGWIPRWVGWVVANEDEKSFLEDLGVKVGKYNKKAGCFEGCSTTNEGLDKLEPHWGRFFWGFNPRS